MDERKAFEAWRRTPLQALTMAYGPKPHPDVEELAWRAWQAATLAERERAANVCEELHASTVNNPERRNALFDAAAAIRKG